jgi:hypothetical protein
MEFTVPFFYLARNTLPRGSKIKESRFVGTAVVDVPVLQARDAPVALTYRRDREKDPARVFRFHDGRFLRHEFLVPSDLSAWISVGTLSGSDEDVNPNVICSAVAWHIERDHRMHLSSWYTYERGREELVNTTLQASGADVDKARDDAEAAMREAVARLVVIDGDIWQTCEEPKLILGLETEEYAPMCAIYSNGSRFGATVNEDQRRFVGSPATTPLFSVLDVDGFEETVAAFVRARAARDRHDLRRYFDHGSIDVTLPEVFAFERSHDIARRSSEAFLAFSGPMIHTCDDAFIDRWKEVRRLAARLAAPDAAIEERAMRLVSSMAGILPDRKRREIESSLALWNETPIRFAGIGVDGPVIGFGR